MKTMQYALKLRREADMLERWSSLTYVAPDYYIPDDSVAEGERRTSYLLGLAKAKRAEALAILDAHSKAGANQ